MCCCALANHCCRCIASCCRLPALLLLVAGRLLMKHFKLLPVGCTVGCFAAALQLLLLVSLLAKPPELE
jgi:hypothetical protein